MRLDFHMRVEAADRAGSTLHLGLADLRGGVDHLALQVGECDRVIIDDTDRADARCSQVKQRRRTEPAGADNQYARSLERSLTRAADLLQHDMAGIAFKLLWAEHRRLLDVGRHTGEPRLAAPAKVMRSEVARSQSSLRDPRRP